MKNIKLTNTIVLFWCCLLSIGLFMADLRTPSDIYVGKFYAVIALLSLWFPKQRQTLLFSMGVTSLAIIAFLLDPLKHDLSALINRGTSLLLIWGITGLGLLYKWGQETRLRLASIIDSSQDAIIGATYDGVITSWNKGAQDLYGYSAFEARGRLMKIVIPDDRMHEFSEIVAGLKAGERIRNYETIRKRKNGSLINVSITISPVENFNGEPIGVSIIARNITERVQREKELQELHGQVKAEKDKLEQVIGIEEGLNSIIDLHKLIDFLVQKTAEILEAERCSILLIDEKAEDLGLRGAFGIPNRESLTGRVKLGESISGLVAQRREAFLVDDIETDERFRRKNASQYTSNSFLSAPIQLDNVLIGVINVSNKNSINGNIFSLRDLKILTMICHQAAIAIENARHYRELKYLTITDPITNIHNYRHFVNSLDHELKRLKRYQGSLCLMMIDIDNFKTYNDTFGHLEGDSLLREVSQVLKDNLRESDIFCRYAGDEFVVILPEAQINQAQMVAEKIRKKVYDLPLKQAVSLSIGIAQCAHSRQLNRHDLVLKADMALYQAKKEGRNRVFVS